MDPDTGANTQHIEASWRSMRRRLARGAVKDNLDLHLCELLWRKKTLSDGKDLFKDLIDAIKIVYQGYPECPPS